MKVKKDVCRNRILLCVKDSYRYTYTILKWFIYFTLFSVFCSQPVWSSYLIISSITRYISFHFSSIIRYNNYLINTRSWRDERLECASHSRWLSIGDHKFKYFFRLFLSSVLHIPCLLTVRKWTSIEFCALEKNSSQTKTYSPP